MQNYCVALDSMRGCEFSRFGVARVAMSRCLRKNRTRWKYARAVDRAQLNCARQVRVRPARVANRRESAVEKVPCDVGGNCTGNGRVRATLVLRHMSRQVYMEIDKARRQYAIVAI